METLLPKAKYTNGFKMIEMYVFILILILDGVTNPGITG
jgi:hypothetical protein